MKHRLALLLLCSLILLLGVPPVHGAQAETIQLTVQPFFEGRYRVGSWLPLRVTVANSGSDVTAIVSARSGATFETPIELPRGANKSVVLYTQPTGVFKQTAIVRVLVGGNEVKKVELPLNGVDAMTQVFGVLTEQPLAMPLPQGNAQTQKFAAVPIPRADLPERSEGLNMFDVLIVDGAPLADLTPTQQQALADWVRTGGQLVLGGSKLDVTLSQMPEMLRPATIGGNSAGGRSNLLPEIEVLQSATLLPVADARTIGTIDAAQIAVQRLVGTGSVTALGFNLSAPELAQLPAQSTFWSRVVQLRSTSPALAGMPPHDMLQAQQLGFALMTLPVLAMPPLGILMALLALYVLVVGPGLYLVLRRLDRQAWAWVAIPAVTLVFSLGAYGYGLQLRGDDLILNQISIIEPGAGRSLVRTFGGVFSPRTATYNVNGSSDALFKPMPSGDWGPAPGGPATGNFVQGSSGVRALDVAQWSMSSFTAEQMIDGSPLEAALTLTDGVLRGTVRNTGTAKLLDVALFQSTRVAKIGDLEPGQARDVELKVDGVAPADWGGSITMSLLRDKWDFNKPMSPPADIRMQQAILDALFSTPYSRPGQPMLIGWLEQAPLVLTLDQGRVQRQQLALVTMPTNVSYPSGGNVSLPRGWIQPMIESSSPGGGPCFSQFGNGWYVDTGMVTSTLQLPPRTETLQIDKATLFIRTEGPPPPKMQLDVFDWNANEWVAQPKALDEIGLEQPERFFSDAGTLKLRLDLQNVPGMGIGCLSTDLSIEGKQP